MVIKPTGIFIVQNGQTFSGCNSILTTIRKCWAELPDDEVCDARDDDSSNAAGK